MGLNVEGQENIPKHGAVIIAPNHISNWDPPIIAVSVALRREVFFIAKEELFSVNNFYSLLLRKCNVIPIKRQGIDKKAIRLTSFYLKRGRVIVIFPEGKRSRGKGFLKPLPGVGYFAIKNGIGIIPVFIDGSSERMRNLILRTKRINVRFGKLIDVSKMNLRGSLLKRSHELTNIVMKEIISLGKECSR